MLITNNYLYKNIEINHHLLNIWNDKFRPSVITNNIVNCNSDHYEHLGYAVNICEDNYKNDLHAAIVDIGIGEDHIYSGCVYSDIDNGKQNLTL